MVAKLEMVPKKFDGWHVFIFNKCSFVHEHHGYFIWNDEVSYSVCAFCCDDCWSGCEHMAVEHYK